MPVSGDVMRPQNGSDVPSFKPTSVIYLLTLNKLFMYLLYFYFFHKMFVFFCSFQISFILVWLP